MPWARLLLVEEGSQQQCRLSQPQAGMRYTQYRQHRARARAASAAAHPPASTDNRLLSSSSSLSLSLSTRGPVLELSIRSVVSSTAHAQPSRVARFISRWFMPRWSAGLAGPVSAAQKHAGMVRQAGYPLVWYLSSALSAGWRLKSGDGSTAAPFWIPSLPE